MKAFLIVLFALATWSLQSQTTCETALPFCASGVSGVTFPASVNSPPSQAGPDYGCLFSQPNPAWYYLQISQSGNLDILIQGTITSPPGPGQDVDFICWGPFASLAGVCNSLTATYSVDCSYSGSFTETLNIPNGIAGEYYIVLITNFANVPQNIIFSQYAGTGSTNCGLLTVSSTSICSGSSGTLVATNTGNLTSPIYSIQPGGLSNPTGSFVLTPTVTTDYTLFISGLNSQSVSTTNTAVATITVNPLPIVAPTSTQATCTSSLNALNLGLNFSPATPVPAYTVNWSPQPTGITNATQTIANNSSPGIYSATVTAAGGCNAIANITINAQPGLPVFTLSPPGNTFTITCANPTITLYATDPTINYNWVNGVSAPITGSVANLTNLSLGNWSVTGTDPVSSCVITHTFNLGINTTPPTSTLTPNYQLITCTNSAVQTITTTALTPTVNTSHNFYFSNGLNVGPVNAYTAIVQPPPGTHTYVLTNNVNGCTVVKTFTVATSSGFPTFTLTSPIQNYSIGCVPKHTVDINIANAQSDPPNLPVTYTILPPSSGTLYTTGLVSAYTFSTPGQYTVVVKDVGSGCETKAPFSVIQNTFSPQIQVSIPDRTITCATPSVQLVGSSTNPSIGYQWYYTTTGVQPGSTYTVNTTAVPSNTLINTYTFVVTDNNNACKSQSLVPIWQNIYPPIAKIGAPNGSTISAVVSCNTPSITLTNASTWGSGGIFPTPQGVASILWEGPSPQIPKPNSTTYLAIQPGTYTMTAKDLNNGCTALGTFTVIDNKDYPVVNNPVSAPVVTLDCGANSATVQAFVTSTVAVKYEWYDVLGLIKTATLAANSTTAFAPVGNVGQYQIYVTNETNGCVSKGYATVVNGVLTPAFNMDKTTGFAPLSVTFNNTSSSSLGTSSISSVWSFGNGNTQTVTAANYATPIQQTYNQPGTYTVVLFTSKGQCVDSTAKLVVVEIPSKLEVPNVFTPNGDGNNDLFFVRMANLTALKISIYDRWGNLVYEVENSSGNVEWDGKNQYGKESAEGTYFYIMTATGKEGKAYDTKGTISLFR